MKKNLKLNNISCRIITKALSNREKKTVGFYYNHKNPAFSKISEGMSENMVDTISIENLQKKMRKIDLLKLDIEGEEIMVLEEINPKKRVIKNIILETHFDKYPSKFDLAKLMASKGFELLPKMNHWKKLNSEIEYPFMIFKRK